MTGPGPLLAPLAFDTDQAMSPDPSPNPSLSFWLGVDQ